LNAPLAPKFFNSFDAIYDGGTLEHVFDVPRALANIHSLLKVGGRVMHASPVSNYVDHGLYCFSPTLFWDYYAANGYEVNQCLMTARTADLSAEALLFSYQPGSLDNLTDGGFNTERFGKYNIFDQFFVATKQPTSTSGVVPMQSRYSRMWGEGDAYGKMPREFRLLGAV
jgi:SAM-dependent methyltransferase